jgi:hypothetical protein
MQRRAKNIKGWKVTGQKGKRRKGRDRKGREMERSENDWNGEKRREKEKQYNRKE